MMRVVCPHCSEVVEAAGAPGAIATCPACRGRFTIPALEARPGPPIQVELSAKKWKTFQVIGAIIVCVALIVFVVSLLTAGSRGATLPSKIGLAVGILLFAVGLAVHYYGRTAAWWHHG